MPRLPLPLPLALALSLALLGPLAGCQDGGSLQVRVVGYAPGLGQELGLVVKTLRTLDDLASLSGGAARFYRNGRLVLDEPAIEAALEQASTQGKPFGAAEINAMVVRDGGEPVRISWVEQDGVIVPEDYDSLVLLSAYAALEQGYLTLVQTQQAELALASLKAFYAPAFTDQNGANQLDVPLLDNAMYFSPSHCMLLLPGQELEEVPLPANPGVLLHEYSHAVFDRAVFGGEYFAFTLVAPRRKTVNLLRAFDEGTADFFAAALTGDPGFVGKSMPALAEARDLNLVRFFDPVMEREAASEQAYDPYLLGSVWASTLWALGAVQGMAATLDLLLRTLPGLGHDLDQFGVLTLPELLARQARDQGADQAVTCRVLRQRFALASWPADSACVSLSGKPEAAP